jgi:ethanolamine utilization protein EutM
MAVGLVECRGMVATMAAIEAMCKSADVAPVLVERVSGGVLVAAIVGDLASVQHALEAAEGAVGRLDQLRNIQIYPHPTDEVARLLVGTGEELGIGRHG